MAGAAASVSVAVAVAVSVVSASGAAAQPDSTSADTPIRAKAADALRSFKVPPELVGAQNGAYFVNILSPEIEIEAQFSKLYPFETFATEGRIRDLCYRRSEWPVCLKASTKALTL